MNTPWIITSEDLKTALNSERPPVLLDVREQEEFDETHIKDCVLIPMGELTTRAEKELNKDSPIVVYCAHGVRSLQALMHLKSVGFRDIKSLDGGICEWENSNHS